MNGLVVLAACVCATSAQVLVGGYAGAVNPNPSTQFHAQDEFGQFSFGHAGGPSARTEARNAYGVTTGSYQYVDANGLLQTVNYVADPVNGFRVAGTNLPVGPAVPAVAAVEPLVAPTFNPEPLVAPVFTGVAPEPVQDTPEVAEAKALHLAALAEAEAAAADRKRRDADEEAVVAAPAIAALPYPYAAGLNLAGLPAAGLPLNYAGVAGVPALNYAGVAGVPALNYAGVPALNYAVAAPAPAAVPVAAPVATVAAPAIAAPVAYAGAPARDAVLTTIKLNPGHAVAYRVD